MLTSLKALLSSIVDYAGLFPPAQLSLVDAMAMYVRARRSPHRWMLDRFVIPAARLRELVEQLPPLPASSDAAPSWPLSVILSKNWAAELPEVRQLADVIMKQDNHLQINSLEVAPLLPAEIQQVCLHRWANIPLFFELPWDIDLAPYLDVLHRTRTAAKLRTGGTTPDAFPSNLQLSQRILSLAEAPIPFKATAGLHHPLRSSRRLIDSSQAPLVPMHGFLNVAILAALAYQKKSLTVDEAIAILEAPFLDSFQVTDTELQWGSSPENKTVAHYSLSITEIEQSRQQFFRSFGSCSFQEPIDDLQALGLL